MTILKRAFKMGLFILLLVLFLFSSNTKDNIEDLKKNESFSKGIISLTFDDGLTSVYKIVFPLMDSYGYNGTVYLIARPTEERFENKELITSDQAKEMQDNGWEIGSHGINHTIFSHFDDQNLEKEISLSKKILEEKGFEITGIAFPYGNTNDRARELTEKYYSYSRSLNLGMNNLSNLSYQDLRVLPVQKSDSVEDICLFINMTKTNEQWLILVFHDILEKDYRSWEWPTENFRKALDCIKDSGANVKTVKEVIESV